jgi:hypothetical protein
VIGSIFPSLLSHRKFKFKIISLIQNDVQAQFIIDDHSEIYQVNTDIAQMHLIAFEVSLPKIDSSKIENTDVKYQLRFKS